MFYLLFIFHWTKLSVAQLHRWRRPRINYWATFILFWNTMVINADHSGRAKAWVCSRSLAGNVGSNTTGGIDISCGCCCCQVEVTAIDPSLVQKILSSVVCLSVIVKPRWGCSVPLLNVVLWTKLLWTLINGNSYVIRSFMFWNGYVLFMTEEKPTFVNTVSNVWDFHDQKNVLERFIYAFA